MHGSTSLNLERYFSKSCIMEISLAFICQCLRWGSVLVVIVRNTVMLMCHAIKQCAILLQLSPVSAAVDRSRSCSPMPTMMSSTPALPSHTTTSSLHRMSPTSAVTNVAGRVPLHSSDIPPRQPSRPVTPVSVCTPAGSPSPARVFDLPGSNTPTPPPKPATPVNKLSYDEVKVKLEIPEIDDKIGGKIEGDSIVSRRRSSKTSKLKPDPLSINNDVVVNHSVTSPLMTRGLLPSLNTPMFLTSPMLGHQRTPLIPGIHFWGPGTLSPGVATLSPRFGGGLHAGPAFQFPAFALSPATLASFSSFHDSVFTSSAAATGSATNGSDKKI